MVTIRNKFIVLAAVFWLGGIVSLLLGALLKENDWAGTLLTIGIIAQAMSASVSLATS